jgi:hypothetical protein
MMESDAITDADANILNLDMTLPLSKILRVFWHKSESSRSACVRRDHRFEDTLAAAFSGAGKDGVHELKCVSVGSETDLAVHLIAMSKRRWLSSRLFDLLHFSHRCARFMEEAPRQTARGPFLKILIPYAAGVASGP